MHFVNKHSNYGSHAESYCYIYTMSNNNVDSAPLIPLVPEEREVSKERQSSFRCYSTPGDVTTTRYDMVVSHIDGEEGIPHILHFVRQVDKLRVSTNVQDADGIPTFSGLIETMLHGQAKAHYKEGLLLRRTEIRDQARMRVRLEHMNNAADRNNMTEGEIAAMNTAMEAIGLPAIDRPIVNVALNVMIRQLVPVGALARIKRFLRRGCRKPANMKIRSYTTHLRRINDEDLPMLPPFAATNKIPEDEVKEIIQYAIPNAWNRKLREQSRDPVMMTYNQLVETLENYESAETDFDATGKSQNSNGNKTKKGNAKKGNNKSPNKANDNDGDKPRYHCIRHGYNNTHDTADCTVLKKLADADKNAKGKSGSKNKTWKRTNDDSKKDDTTTKQEVQAYVKEAFKAELKAAKKRKTKDLNNVEFNLDSKNDDTDWNSVDFDELDKFIEDNSDE